MRVMSQLIILVFLQLPLIIWGKLTRFENQMANLLPLNWLLSLFSPLFSVFSFFVDAIDELSLIAFSSAELESWLMKHNVEFALVLFDSKKRNPYTYTQLEHSIEYTPCLCCISQTKIGLRNSGLGSYMFYWNRSFMYKKIILHCKYLHVMCK